MNLYLIVIGLISVVSCALIIICINKPSSKASFPTDGSKSPLKQQGLTEQQKKYTLLIVCVIFFLSMVTTNIKSSKFSLMFDDLMSITSHSTSSKVIDLKKVFYGPKGDSKFQPNQNQYPILFQYLKEGKVEQRFLDKLLQKNFDSYLFQKASNNEQVQKMRNKVPELRILSSYRRNLGGELVLPWTAEKLCQSGSTNSIPLLYLNLSQQINNQQQLVNLFNLDSYQTLKQSMCRLNGIQITKQIQKIGDYYIQKETYSQLQNTNYKQRQNAYLIINNFQYLNQVLIFNRNYYVFQVGNNHQKNQNNQVDQQNTEIPQFLGPQYQLFIDKLLTDLMPNCKINVILHTNYQKEVNKLYKRWKSFNSNSSPANNFKFNSFGFEDFPFDVRKFQGINKIQFYEMLKSIISQSSRIKAKQDFLWKLFQKSFGKVSISSRKVISDQKEETIKVENNQQILLTEIQRFFIKLTEQLNRDPNKQTIIKIKDSHTPQIRQKIAEYYGSGPAYAAIKNLHIPQRGVSFGLIKKKVSMEDIQKLRELELLYIKEGKIYLVD